MCNIEFLCRDYNNNVTALRIQGLILPINGLKFLPYKRYDKVQIKFFLTSSNHSLFEKKKNISIYSLIFHQDEKNVRKIYKKIRHLCN